MMNRLKLFMLGLRTVHKTQTCNTQGKITLTIFHVTYNPMLLYTPHYSEGTPLNPQLGTRYMHFVG